MGPVVGVGELLWDVFPGGRKVAGGAPFNFAFHCRQLGRDAVIVSRVGDDSLGDELRAAVRGLGMTDEFIQVDPSHPTGTVRITLADGVPSYTISEGVAWDFIEWTPELEKLAAGAAAVGAGTLARRGESRHAVMQLQYRCPGLRFTDVNLRQHYHSQIVLLESLVSATVVKMTAEEVRTVGRSINFPRGTVRQLFAHCPELTGVAVTDGERGAEWRDRGRWVVRAPGVPVGVVDTVGAGDAFSAALVCGLLDGRPVGQILREANRYAAEVCRHAGGTPEFDWPPAGGIG